jgi:hypothetical protein
MAAHDLCPIVLKQVFVKIRAKVLAASNFSEPDCHDKPKATYVRQIGGSVSVSDGTVDPAILESRFDQNLPAMGEVV